MPEAVQTGDVSTEPQPTPVASGIPAAPTPQPDIAKIITDALKPITAELADTKQKLSSMKKSNRREIAKLRKRGMQPVDDDLDDDDDEDDIVTREERNADAPFTAKSYATSRAIVADVNEDPLYGAFMQDPRIAAQVEQTVLQGMGLGLDEKAIKAMAIGTIHPSAVQYSRDAEARKAQQLQGDPQVPAVEPSTAVPSVGAGGGGSPPAATGIPVVSPGARAALEGLGIVQK